MFHLIVGPMARAPRLLLAYVSFAVVVTLLDWGTLPFATEAFRANLVPYLGWSPCMFYAFTIFFAFALIYQRERRRSMRFAITMQLLIQIAYGIFQLSRADRPNYGNPWLTISPWQTVWTILIPSVWIVALHTQHVNRFCRQAQESNVA